MPRPKAWGYSEKMLLIEKYEALTIKELEQLFPNRSRESINNKIKRLKRTGEITDNKDNDTVKRSYIQRGKDLS
jgi:hypothetical protein